MQGECRSCQPAVVKCSLIQDPMEFGCGGGGGGGWRWSRNCCGSIVNSISIDVQTVPPVRAVGVSAAISIVVLVEGVIGL